jgi:transaldolase
MNDYKDLNIKIFADTADIGEIGELIKNPLIRGFTTNPSLMKKAGTNNYSEFAKIVLDIVRDMPVSFEVFSDDFEGMKDEARKISSWGKNVYVKIPVTNTKGEFSQDVIETLSKEGIALNITAAMTPLQVKKIAGILSRGTKSIVSIFAGRISDTGQDPVPLMKECSRYLEDNSNAELLWASTREILNIFQANNAGTDIITITPDIIKKFDLLNKDLEEYSLDTVKQFFNDSKGIVS